MRHTTDGESSTLQRLTASFAIALLIAALTGCSDGNDTMQAGETPDTSVIPPAADPNIDIPAPTDLSIVDTLLEQQFDYSRLLSLIQEADLADDLQADNMGVGWTLFAPSDGAFETDEFDALDLAQRRALVASHIYPGRLLSSDLMTGSLAMRQGSVAVVVDAAGNLSVGGASIVARDRQVANGIIHYVDRLLMPE